ncbi:MAG TPA: YtxH domain-containing protein [Bryobacteraceae bacterium]|nr:YtxH domain-containing protein [Bryobacteraceae bacterium]
MQGKGDNNVLWFVCGAAVGLSAALLLVPESGEQVRGKLADQARNGSRRVAGSGHDLFERGRDVYEKGRDLYERGREIAEEAAQMFDEGRRLAERKIDETL